MPFLKEANAEPLAGYRLLEPLGNGGFGEVWKCEAPGGIFKAIKFVYGDLNGLDADSARAEEELQAIQRVKAIRHPFLLSIDRVEVVAGELVIVTELADRNLQELLSEYQNTGRDGIPRGELLSYLKEAAEVLDLLNQEYDLQHLDIKPRNLFLVRNHVKVADFGLVSSLSSSGAGTAKVQLGAITPLYASPEVFQGKISRHCDQYSLAIVYQELLTGSLPFQGKNCRQLLLQHTKGEPDLSGLSESDRPVVTRALSKDPQKRFDSCMEFIKALSALRSPSSHSGSVSLPAAAAAASLASDAHDTQGTHKADTDPTRKRSGRSAPTDLPGYRFLECLGTSPLGEQWKAQGPDGRPRLIKFVYGFSAKDRKRIEEALVQFRSLHHPALLPAEVLRFEPGRLILATEPVKETVRDRALQCQARKLPGVMRGELLSYLRPAAEALDYLYEQHSLHHLGLNPRNLVIDQGWLQIADFGLAHLLWAPSGQPVAQQNARYSAPELFDRLTSRTCDQYSLAVIYHEMLTGVHPFRTAGGNGTGAGPNRGQPDLARLPPSDQEVIACALHPDPAKRWANCTEMVSALEGLVPGSLHEPGGIKDRFIAILEASRKAPPPPLPLTASRDLNKVIADLVASAGGEVPTLAADELPSLSEDGESLRHRFIVGLPLGSARVKLDSFCQQWYAQLVREDDRGVIIHINLPTNFWGKMMGRHPGLEIVIKLARVQPLSATPIDVNAEVRAFNCAKKRAQQLLEEMGPQILESLRALLLVNSEKRTKDRLLWPHPLKVCPLDADGKPGEPVECWGKDISLTGIGFYLPEELETSEVLIHVPNTVHPPSVAVPASLVRAKRCADGWYEVGALFRLPVLHKAPPEAARALAAAR
jgi:serine/threonine protein kinase